MFGLVKDKSESIPLFYELLMFIIIYCSHDTLLFGTSSYFRLRQIEEIIPFILVVIVIIAARIRFINMIKALILSVFLLLPFLSCIYNNEPIGNYIYRFGVMLAAGTIILSLNKLYLFEAYNRIIAFFSICSLVIFALGNISSGILSIAPQITNYNGFKYYFTFFSVVPIVSNSSYVRNYCVFREPGVFMVFLVIAIVIELMVLKNLNMKRLLVYLISLLSTLSTAAYIIFAFVLVYLIALNKEMKFHYKIVLSMLVACAFSFLIFNTNLLSEESEIFDKFIVGSNSYGSWLSRLISITGNLQLLISSPVFGIGRYSLYNTVLGSSGVYVVNDNTNTLMINFSAYGFFFGFLSILGLYKFVRKYNNNWIKAIMMLLFLFLALSDEDMGQNIIYYMLLFEGLLSPYKDRVLSRDDLLLLKK